VATGANTFSDALPDAQQAAAERLGVILRG
jgi:hypothetical protein